MSDLVLARRLLAGEQEAFEEFFSAYFTRVYRFARARLRGDDDAAEEVAQLTLIRAVDKLHTYRGEAALFTWLCTLCRHEIGAWLGRWRRAADVPLVEDHPQLRATLELLAQPADDPESAFERRQLGQLVHATLDHLPGRYGDALEWRYIEGLSVTEIAARLGLGYKATESVLSRARKAFREGFSLVVTEVSPPEVARAPAGERGLS